MKTSSFIIFISVVLTIYSAVNYYIFIRGWQALPDNRWIRIVYLIFFLFLFLSYILARSFEKFDTTGITDFLNITGSFWLGAMLYLFIAVLLFDFIKLTNHFLHYLPDGITADWQKAKLFSLLGTVLTVTIVIVAGYINARNPVTKEINITINKSGGNYKTLKIAMASDLHIGHLFNKENVRELVDKINSQNPDIVLFPGDILDEDVTTVKQFGMGEPFRLLNPKLGVWAITGNHEYIGGVETGVNYIRSLGINMLRDETSLIDSSFYLVGREDRDKGRFSGVSRKELKDIINGIDISKPTILLDHQPFNLEVAEKGGIDLQLSGHTHHGQLFPFNFITRMVYEISWGYLKKANTQYYVSCGYGTWGPPVRTGNRPELIIINIQLK